jgi:Skp family chaperone for outer membrane proteins
MKLFYIVAAMLIAAPFALAADDKPATSSTARIGIANVGKILTDMQETKDLQSRLATEGKNLEQMVKEKQQKLKDLEAARNTIRPESPLYQERNRELMQMAIEYDSWLKMTQADMQRQQKLQTKMLFEKIQTAIGKVAAAKGFDLVIADQRGDLPENVDQINIDQLRGLINNRIILYSNNSMDITQDVITRLDEQYIKAK